MSGSVIWIVFVLGAAAPRSDFDHPRTLAKCLAEVHAAQAKEPEAIAWCAATLPGGRVAIVSRDGGFRS